MEEAAALLILIGLGLGLIGTGPLALILFIVFHKKLTQVQSRLERLEKGGLPAAVPVQAKTAPQPGPCRESARTGGAPVVDLSDVHSDATVQKFKAAAEAQVQAPTSVPDKPVPSQSPQPVSTPSQARASRAAPLRAEPPVFSPAADIPQPKRPRSVGGLELKIGTVAILIAGIITTIFGVGFFLRYIYEKGYFNPAARVALVGFGGLTAIVVGEVLRRRNFEVVARGIAALGFAMLYAAVFSGTARYHLFSSQWAFAFSIVVTAGAMTYAVILNEILIAFLSLVGGYLAPVLISAGQNQPMSLFSYTLALSAGAMGCAMFRRWRAVNWIALTGTWLLYTAWFEKFYTADQAGIALAWLSVFALLYMVLPVLFNLVRRIEARVEDVVLIVVNGVTVFYFLWQILETFSQKWLACGAAVLGTAHLALMFAALWRCPADKKLHASLGVLGVVFITASLPMYFSLQTSLVGWAVEAVALAYIGIRYRGIWTQVMSFLVAGAAAAGLFYHLPLHSTAGFRVFINAPFGTWLFVSAALLVCHLFWRRMRPKSDAEAGAASQLFYAWAAILLAVGIGLEWYAHCDLNIAEIGFNEALFLKGMMALAILLAFAFFCRPLSPSGLLVRNVGIVLSVMGAVFFAVAMMGVYNDAFRLFVNLPFALAAVYVLELFWIARHLSAADQNSDTPSVVSALVFLAMLLLLIVLTEQMYRYWFCRHEYAGFEGDWKACAIRYVLITWAAYGLAALYAGIRFARNFIQVTACLVTGLSAAGLFFLLPLHEDARFRLFYNAPFVTWLVVGLAVMAGHALWRFMRQSGPSQCMAQLYYVAGLLLPAVGICLEWAAHSRWQLEPDALARSHLLLGLIVIGAITVQLFFAHPLPPNGGLVVLAGAAVALAGGIFAAFAMLYVYYDSFTLYLNWPFAMACLYALGVLLAAWHVRRSEWVIQNNLSSAFVLAGLILVWILLSEQVYSFWSAKHAYGSADLPNWRWSAQAGISVTWGVYAALLMIVGFWARSARVRWLSLVIFAVLLGKIFVIDIPSLRTEYRIAAFITTGLILIGVSFLYQLLKNKGFFESLDRQKQIT